MKIAIIGGSLLGEMREFTGISEAPPQTPYGEPSGIFSSGRIHGMEVVYLNRHGPAHHLAPHQINYRANIFALDMLGVSHAISMTAVGGISKLMSPMQWVVPDQLIDYTYGREHTFNEYDAQQVQHIDFTWPFDDGLRNTLQQAVNMAGMSCIARGTYGVTQGPRLETIAEIIRLERDGCDIVGMTAMPEAALARELDINYATLSLVVNWAAGKGDEAEIISMEEISRRIAEGNQQVQEIVRQVIAQFE
jgi:5'-deoxy-5'-methylthioadenosine phosphorylase